MPFEAQQSEFEEALATNVEGEKQAVLDRTNFDEKYRDRLDKLEAAIAQNSILDPQAKEALRKDLGEAIHEDLDELEGRLKLLDGLKTGRENLLRENLYRQALSFVYQLQIGLESEAMRSVFKESDDWDPRGVVEEEEYAREARAQLDYLSGAGLHDLAAEMRNQLFLGISPQEAFRGAVSRFLENPDNHRIATLVAISRVPGIKVEKPLNIRFGQFNTDENIRNEKLVKIGRLPSGTQFDFTQNPPELHPKKPEYVKVSDALGRVFYVYAPSLDIKELEWTPQGAAIKEVQSAEAHGAARQETQQQMIEAVPGDPYAFLANRGYARIEDGNKAILTTRASRFKIHEVLPSGINEAQIILGPRNRFNHKKVPIGTPLNIVRQGETFVFLAYPQYGRVRIYQGDKIRLNEPVSAPTPAAESAVSSEEKQEEARGWLSSLIGKWSGEAEESENDVRVPDPRLIELNGSGVITLHDPGVIRLEQGADNLNIHDIFSPQLYRVLYVKPTSARAKILGIDPDRYLKAVATGSTFIYTEFPEMGRIKVGKGMEVSLLKPPEGKLYAKKPVEPIPLNPAQFPRDPKQMAEIARDCPVQVLYTPTKGLAGHPWGHIALLVDGKVYSYGRWGKTEGAMGMKGEGALFVFNSLADYERAESGRVLATPLFGISHMERSKIRDYYLAKIQKGDTIEGYRMTQMGRGEDPTPETHYRGATEYIIDDYNVFDQNCTTLTLNALEAAGGDISRAVGDINTESMTLEDFYDARVVTGAVMDMTEALGISVTDTLKEAIKIYIATGEIGAVLGKLPVDANGIIIQTGTQYDGANALNVYYEFLGKRYGTDYVRLPENLYQALQSGTKISQYNLYNRDDFKYKRA